MIRQARGRDPRPRGTELRRRPEERTEQRVIYVVAEGEGTEYDYLAHIRHYGPHFGFIVRTPNPAKQRNGLPPRRAVDEAASKVGQLGIDQVWALFDRDSWPDVPQACADARRLGVHAALSHPAFELWLLLHFPDKIPAAQAGRNDDVVDKLRRASLAFADYARRSKRVDERRFEALRDADGIREAVKQARTLVDRCPSGCGCSARSGHTSSCGPNSRDPSTDVYLLIHSLGIIPNPS
jgi:RloB-like protein